MIHFGGSHKGRRTLFEGQLSVRDADGHWSVFLSKCAALAGDAGGNTPVAR